MADKQTQAIRAHRQESFQKRWPRIQRFCEGNGILIREVQHGFQFRYREYAITWSPSTNSVSIQFCVPGSSNTLPYSHAGKPDKPRILVALEEVVSLGQA